MNPLARLMRPNLILCFRRLGGQWIASPPCRRVGGGGLTMGNHQVIISAQNSTNRSIAQTRAADEVARCLEGVQRRMA